MITIRTSALLLAIVAIMSVAYAQKSAKPAKNKSIAATTTPVLAVPVRGLLEVVMGRDSRSGGNISKAEFDAAAPLGIRLKEANGATIEGFSFTYGERNMYEDSASNPIIVTDYLTEYCMGDTLSPIISSTIASRTKPGDTAYYDDIHIRLPDGKSARGKAMKFVIR